MKVVTDYFHEPLRWKGRERSWSMKIFTSSHQYSFYDIVFICNVLLRELMPNKYGKCINFFLQKIWSTTTILITKKVHYNEYKIFNVMIKWKLNVILFILLKGNSYFIVCMRIFLLWTYRYRGFKIFWSYRQPTLEK